MGITSGKMIPQKTDVLKPQVFYENSIVQKVIPVIRG